MLLSISLFAYRKSRILEDNKVDIMPRLLSGLLLSLVILFGYPPAASAPTQTATLVEVRAMPGCAGLDCPPWPMPMNINICLEINGTYFTATYRPWGVPWATSGKKLLKLAGKSIQVIVTEKYIRVVTPRFNTRFIRMHRFPMFDSLSCNAS